MLYINEFITGGLVDVSDGQIAEVFASNGKDISATITTIRAMSGAVLTAEQVRDAVRRQWNLTDTVWPPVRREFIPGLGRRVRHWG